MTVKTLKDDLAVGDTVSVVSGCYSALYGVTSIRERIPEKRKIGLERLTRPVNVWSVPS